MMELVTPHNTNYIYICMHTVCDLSNLLCLYSFNRYGHLIASFVSRDKCTSHVNECDLPNLNENLKAYIASVRTRTTSASHSLHLHL